MKKENKKVLVMGGSGNLSAAERAKIIQAFQATVPLILKGPKEKVPMIFGTVGEAPDFDIKKIFTNNKTEEE